MTEDNQDDTLRLARIRVQTGRRTVLLFLVFGIVWVVSTDFLANAILSEESPFWNQFQTLKGTVFVILSCVLIYVSIIRHAEHVLASEASSQDRLRHTEMEFRAMVETMTEGVCTLDMNSRLLYANPRFCEITGFRHSEIVRSDLFEILSVSATLPELIRSGSSELTIRDRRGHRKLISVRAVARHDRGAQVGTLCLIDDLTELRRSEAERERLHAQIEQMKRIESLGQLSGTMAHEFNNVMAGILPFTEVIERTAPNDEKIISATRYIKQAVSRGRRISQEVLRFARPMPLARQSVKVSDLIKRIEAAGRSLFGARHQLRVVVAAVDELIDIDLEQIEQVLTNLLINAGEAMDTHGTVELSVRRDPALTTYGFGVVPNPERFVHFAVEDDGCGIPEEVLERIFEPFVTTKRRGTGLGLAITYQIIANHHGYIFAESTEGKSTTMHLFLPVSDPTAASPGDQQELRPDVSS